MSPPSNSQLSFPPLSLWDNVVDVSGILFESPGPSLPVPEISPSLFSSCSLLTSLFVAALCFVLENGGDHHKQECSTKGARIHKFSKSL